jgi:hypothetical protein
MKKITSCMALASFVLLMAACGIKGHNHKELAKVSSNEERVHGDKNGPPRQLPNKYEDDGGKTAARVEKIKSTLYPK